MAYQINGISLGSRKDIVSSSRGKPEISRMYHTSLFAYNIRCIVQGKPPTRLNVFERHGRERRRRKEKEEEKMPSILAFLEKREEIRDVWGLEGTSQLHDFYVIH
ncbi:hypothetical protein MGYG_01696 [Nannizzia gypsea CBS 118893]|uniref:Uncharacterized protein n=1 Tax=Arthroderma gypseum (strain ATCC MYA-4604 / CBS 118893) TaxID=535722 RepID=E5R2L7_ARTGP|nr:hypothetical protein MGYG_01696 [Nannizzia gypsea CBS 118893]EFQ98675.1 hypothetical protein MGYG_01696 [Nannizzia gypsea CBS 118893]